MQTTLAIWALTVALGIPTGILVVGLARQASQKRNPRSPAVPSTRRRIPNRAASWLAVSAMFGAWDVFLGLAMNATPYLLVFTFGAMILPSAITGMSLWKSNGRLGRIGIGEALCLTVAGGFLGGIAVSLAVRNDHLRSIPAQAVLVTTCVRSIVVPDEGNQLNRSVAGSTASAGVGSKLYITDAPSGSAVKLDGAMNVCDAGQSGFGEILIATTPGEATLYITATDGDIYRLGVHVAGT